VSTPEIPEWQRALARQAASAAENIRQALLPMVPLVEQARERIAEGLLANADLIQSAQRTLAQMEQAWRVCTPENWHELEPDELETLMSLAQDAGICLVWAPRTEVIRRVLAAADPEAAIEVLADAGDLILDDLEEVLSEVRETEIDGHSEARAFAAEAIAAARDGHFHAAQSLAASGLGQVLHVALGFPLFYGLGRAYREFAARSIDDASIWVVKVTLIELATARALTDVDKTTPTGFDRHGTQHGVREFFSTGNALAGLLLLVAWTRELQWIADEYPEGLRDDE